MNCGGGVRVRQLVVALRSVALVGYSCASTEETGCGCGFD